MLFYPQQEHIHVDLVWTTDVLSILRPYAVPDYQSFVDAAVQTLDDVTIISEATARATQRLKQEEESERDPEQTISSGADHQLHSLFNTICHRDDVSHHVCNCPFMSFGFKLPCTHVLHLTKTLHDLSA